MLPFIFIGWFCSIVSSYTCANLTNEQFELAQYAYQEAVRNEINPELFLELIACESKFSKSALGDYQSKTNTYISRGLLQFQKSTFRVFSKKYGLTNLEWMNPRDQITLASRMISKGLWRHWYQCGKIVGYGI